jgi:hypothetical protein
MRRSTIYTGEIPRDYDLLKAWQSELRALGTAGLDLLGGTTHDPNAPAGITGTLNIGQYPGWANGAGGVAPLGTGGTYFPTTAVTSGANGFKQMVLAGFYPVADATDLGFGVDTGTVYILAAVDNTGNLATSTGGNGGTSTQYGDLATNTNPPEPDTQVILQQCVIPAASWAVVAPGAGTYNWYLVTAQPEQLDETDDDDPNYQGGSNAILPYFNSASPTSPLYGPSGGGTRQPTARTGTGVLNLVGPINSSSDSSVPSGLVPATGNVPMYIIVVPHGATTFGSSLGTTAVWYVVGRGGAPALASPYAGPAPFLTGHLHQHHLGVPGSAPKIDGGVEWKPLSSVDNNGQNFVDAAALQITGLYGSTATVAAPSSTPAVSYVAGSGVTSVADASGGYNSEVGGAVGITVAGSQIGVAGSGSAVLGSVRNASARNPVSVILTLESTTSALALPPGLAIGVFRDSTNHGFNIVAINETNSTIDIPASATIYVDYIQVF